MDCIVTHSGTISAVIGGKVYSVSQDHKHYEAMKQAVKDNNPDEFERLANIVEEVKKFTHGKVEIRDGVVYYGDEAIHNTLTERILALMDEGFPFEPMLKFLENLMLNPSMRSVAQLYSFLENKNLPITEDGCFLAYKRIRPDWKDYHSGRLDYSVGNVVSMPRNQIDDDPNTHCSQGIHVGGMSYVSNFHAGQGRVVICKVNPRDAVAVPNDGPKLRCCELTVVAEYTGDLTSALYNEAAQVSSCRYEEWDSDYEDDDDDWEDDDIYESAHGNY